MTGVAAVSAPVRAVHDTPDELAARAGVGLLLVLCTGVSVGWLGLGAVVAAVRYWPSAAAPLIAAADTGNRWARAVVEAAPASEPLGQAVPDFAFSLLNLVLAVVLLGPGIRWAGTRTWPIRLLAVALVGSAGAFNLQAHAAARAVEAATGLAVSGLHQVVLHGIACAAYIVALLVFPTPSWDGMPGGRPIRGGLVVVGAAAFLLVGLGTALLPHTTSCVLFFGFLVPAVGLLVLPRRVRRGPGPEARTQARLLFSTLVGGFAVASVLAVVTLLLWLLEAVPGLALVDPTAHGTPGPPVALLFWFARLASAAVAVVVLLATRRDRLWDAERWFSRGLAVLLVTAVAGGTFVVLRAAADEAFGGAGATVLAIVVVELVLSPLYVRAERVVDRLLYGTRPAPYRVLADIAALSQSTLAQPLGAAAGAPDLARVAEAVARGLGAGVCRLTVRRPGLRDRTYEWTDRAGGFGARSESGDLLEVPIRHGAEQVGALAVDRQAVSGLNTQRERLLADIADALGVVLQASRSGIELERQLRAALAHAEEIAVSRRRTVAEMDRERRRIERDLHDGAQHHLVSLRLTLGLVEHQVATGERVAAREWLARLAGQLDRAEAVLAATADGVSSLVLAERGLVAALRAELGEAHPPVVVDDGGVPAGRRFPAEVEAAVWFCCAEAVGNARKHADGAAITVRLAERAGALVFTVRDDGPGFAVAADHPGRGLRNMAARVSTVGGRVSIRSAPGAGTTVEGVVPLPVEPPAVAAPVRVAVDGLRPLDDAPRPGRPAPSGTPGRAGPAGTGRSVEPAIVIEPAIVTEPAIVAEPAVDAAPAAAVDPVADEPAVAAALVTSAPATSALRAPVPAQADPARIPATPPPATPPPAPAKPPRPVDAAAPPDVPTPSTGLPADDDPATAAVERPARLAGQVRELVRAACAAYRGSPTQGRIDDLARRLDEPVRVGVLATVDDGRRMLVEALVGTAVGPPAPGSGAPVPVRYVFGEPGTVAGGGGVADEVVVAVPAPALRAMTLVDVPTPVDAEVDGKADPAGSRRLGPEAAARLRALLAAPGRPPVADAFVLLLHYGRPADVTLLDLLDDAGQHGAIGVLAVADEVGSVAEQAVREYGDDPGIRRVCHALTPVAPAAAAAAARLGDEEHRWLQVWVAATDDDASARAADDALRGDGRVAAVPPAAGPEVAAALLDRLGPLGARRALRLVRAGAGGTRTDLAAALVRQSGLGHLQEMIAARFLRRAEVLRTRSVLAGLDALLQAAPPPGDAARALRYQLERVRAGAHELRETEQLDVLRSGELPLPPDLQLAAGRLLGADGWDAPARLGLAPDAPVDALRLAAAAEPARWRALAVHPIASTRVREFAEFLVTTCDRLVREVDEVAGRR